MKSPARQLLAILVLAALTVVAYANSFSTGFPLDNKALILDDARVHAATRGNVDLILKHSYWWPIGESGLYRPITTLSFLFNYAVLGNETRPLGYHVVNLLLHLLNVILVFALVRRISTRHAFFVAAVWAVHPISTEAVTNIVGRADLLAAAAVLGGLLIYIRARDTVGTARLLWLAALALTTTIGVFAKESAVAIVGVIVLHAVAAPVSARGELVEPRASRRARPSTGSGRANWWALLALAPPVLLLWFQRAAVLGAAPAAEFPFVDNPIAGAGFWRGALTAVAVIGRYLWLLLWPATLSADYSYAQIPLASGTLQEWVAWAVVALIAAGIVTLWRRGEREAFFFAAFAVIAFLPASNLVVVTGTIMAERVMYLPSVGVAALVVLAMERSARQARMPAVAVPVVVVAIVAILGARTWRRNADWQSDVTLWSAAVDAAPRSFKAHRALAEALYNEDAAHGNLGRVVDEIEQAAAILESLPDARNDARTFRQAGAYFLEQGDALRGRASPDEAAPPESRRAYARAVRYLIRSIAVIDAARGPATAKPRADAYRVLSAVYTRLGESKEAVDAAVRARDLDPDNPVSYQQAAAALLAASRGDEAAVILMVGSLVTRDNRLRDELVDLYRRGLDQLGCAVVSTPNGAAINPSCATVRRHVCAATVDAIKIHERAGRADEARRLRDSAARQFQCG